MQSTGQSNQIFQSADLEALSKLRSQGPIFSLYLDLSSDKPDGAGPVERFNQLLGQAEKEAKLDQASPETRQQWQQEAQHIRQQLPREITGGSQGLALFSSQAERIWRVFPLSVPVFDRLVVRGEPYVRTLELLLAEFKCTLVVLLDAGIARLVQVFLGSAQELENLQAVPVTGDPLEIGPRLYARSVAEKVEAAWQEHACNQLVIGGSDDMLEALREELPETLRQNLAGELTLDPQSGLADVLPQVQQIEAEQEMLQEAQRVEELITRAEENNGAVLGAEQSLLAVRDKRVSLLVVEEALHAPGGECINCGYLGLNHEAGSGTETGSGIGVQDRNMDVCPLCGMALRPEADIVEVALKRVHDQGGEIEVLRNPHSLNALELYGRIGALLHGTGAHVVKDMATQRTIAKNGEINQDVLHDEAMQESFPASDPPSYSK